MSFCPPGYFRDGEGRLCKLPPAGDAAAALHAAQRLQLHHSHDRVGPTRVPPGIRRTANRQKRNHRSRKRKLNRSGMTGVQSRSVLHRYGRFMWPWRLRKVGLPCGAAVPRTARCHTAMASALTPRSQRQWTSLWNDHQSDGSRDSSAVLDAIWLDSALRCGEHFIFEKTGMGFCFHDEGGRGKPTIATGLVVGASAKIPVQPSARSMIAADSRHRGIFADRGRPTPQRQSSRMQHQPHFSSFVSSLPKPFDVSICGISAPMYHHAVVLCRRHLRGHICPNFNSKVPYRQLLQRWRSSLLHKVGLVFRRIRDQLELQHQVLRQGVYGAFKDVYAIPQMSDSETEALGDNLYQLRCPWMPCQPEQYHSLHADSSLEGDAHSRGRSRSLTDGTASGSDSSSTSGGRRRGEERRGRHWSQRSTDGGQSDNSSDDVRSDPPAADTLARPPFCHLGGPVQVPFQRNSTALQVTLIVCNSSMYELEVEVCTPRSVYFEPSEDRPIVQRVATRRLTDSRRNILQQLATSRAEAGAECRAIGAAAGAADIGGGPAVACNAPHHSHKTDLVPPKVNPLSPTMMLVQAGSDQVFVVSAWVRRPSAATAGQPLTITPDSTVAQRDWISRQRRSDDGAFGKLVWVPKQLLDTQGDMVICVAPMIPFSEFERMERPVDDSLLSQEGYHKQLRVPPVVLGLRSGRVCVTTGDNLVQIPALEQDKRTAGSAPGHPRQEKHAKGGSRRRDKARRAGAASGKSAKSIKATLQAKASRGLRPNGSKDEGLEPVNASVVWQSDCPIAFVKTVASSLQPEPFVLGDRTGEGHGKSVTDGMTKADGAAKGGGGGGGGRRGMARHETAIVVVADRGRTAGLLALRQDRKGRWRSRRGPGVRLSVSFEGYSNRLRPNYAPVVAMRDDKHFIGPYENPMDASCDGMPHLSRVGSVSGSQYRRRGSRGRGRGGGSLASAGASSGHHALAQGLQQVSDESRPATVADHLPGLLAIWPLRCGTLAE